MADESRSIPKPLMEQALGEETKAATEPIAYLEDLPVVEACSLCGRTAEELLTIYKMYT